MTHDHGVAEKPARVSSLEFFALLNWLDGTPLLDTIEPYRRAIFTAALDTFDGDGRRRRNLVLAGRAKKNWKTSDLVLAAVVCLVANPSPGGNQCYLIANDLDQAADDLTLAKKLVAANPVLAERVVVKTKILELVDGDGFLEILPAGDVAGSHGKTYVFCGFDEIHGYRDWSILEAMQLDPTRPDALMWITSYASVYHKPGVPLFDLTAAGWRGSDPRMLFSWYGADRSADPDFEHADPETRANPSRDSWGNTTYLDQQRARLPAHLFRRLHLNLPGLPRGAAFSAEPVMDAVDRGTSHREPEPGRSYRAFVDMSGGSNDDAVLAIGHVDGETTAVVDVVMNQGAPPPFDPRTAIERFADTLRKYGVRKVQGDRYAGETFRRAFERLGFTYEIAPLSTSKLYEALEPHLNARRVVLPDVPILEQQLLGLVWRGGRIDHPAGEYDDWSNAVAGVVYALLEGHVGLQIYAFTETGAPLTADNAPTAPPTKERRFLEGLPLSDVGTANPHTPPPCLRCGLAEADHGQGTCVGFTTTPADCMSEAQKFELGITPQAR